MAALMLELTRQRRRAEAERRRRTRGLQLRRAAGIRPLSGSSVREAVQGAAERLERLLAEAAGPAGAESAAAGCLAMVRLLKLAALVAAPPRAIPVFGGDLKDVLERTLERWEPELSRRGQLLIPAIEPKLQPALLDERSLDAVLDELIGRAADRLPRRGVVMLSAGAARDGGLRLELKDDGQGARRRSEGIEELGLALCCALVEGWGGMLGVSATPSGRGQQVSLRLLPG